MSCQWTLAQLLMSCGGWQDNASSNRGGRELMRGRHQPQADFWLELGDDELERVTYGTEEKYTSGLLFKKNNVLKYQKCMCHKKNWECFDGALTLYLFSCESPPINRIPYSRYGQFLASFLHQVLDSSPSRIYSPIWLCAGGSMEGLIKMICWGSHRNRATPDWRSIPYF